MAARRNKSGWGGWLFLVLVLLAYGGLGMVEPKATQQAFAFFIHVMGRVLPALGLVFIFLLVTNLMFDPKWIKRHLGTGSGTKGWLAAVIGGVVSMGPIYAWYAMLSEMRQAGMRNSLVAAFLYSRAVKLPLLPIMIHYFGMAYTLVLCLYLIVFSIITGVLVEKLMLQRSG
jgi:uncharacterized membrane protein YraQ (UPF0718 family)